MYLEEPGWKPGVGSNGVPEPGSPRGLSLITYNYT
jgi:hypothetical protein